MRSNISWGRGRAVLVFDRARGGGVTSVPPLTSSLNRSGSALKRAKDHEPYSPTKPHRRTGKRQR